MIEFLFLDLDDTILDFKKAEHIALQKTLRSVGIDPTEEICALYSRINVSYWERLERKELTRPQVLVGRFEELLRTLGVEADAQGCADSYAYNLGIGHYFLPGAEEAVASLAKKYKLYITSNGTASVQSGRLASANISHYFEDVFISQGMGADKPAIEYFNACFARIPDIDPAKTMIVGDSLTSDIQGGINAGIHTCWINPAHKPGREDIRPDYEIENLTQLEALLETM